MKGSKKKSSPKLRPDISSTGSRGEEDVCLSLITDNINTSPT